MDFCDQRTITDQAFRHLKGIYRLDMSNYNIEMITHKAFTYLKGIHSLNI